MFLIDYFLGRGTKLAHVPFSTSNLVYIICFEDFKHQWLVYNQFICIYFFDSHGVEINFCWASFFTIDFA